MSGGNPFAGPRPLGPGDPIFGREREIRELRSLVSAERIVLLYSPSGAGKSSLISAGLLPQLKARFDVWIPTRVNLAPPPHLRAGNRYAWSAAAGFEQEVPERLRRPAESFADMSLREYVAGRPRRMGASRNIVLVLDQFEEILRTEPTDIEGKTEFFRQLGDLLEDQNVWALFALREDFLAPLDPYCVAVPTHLRYRYRIDLLSRESASEAMAKTAAAGGREFQGEAIDRLAGDLSAVRIQQPDGTFQLSEGLYVEPLQLQVVCRNLWDRMPAEALLIRIEHVEEFADATQALAKYYAEELGRIAKGDAVCERALREWIETKLITREGVRGLAMRGAGNSQGLDNGLISQLVDTHLVRAEERGGTVWYELAHDRLVEPIRQDNARWRENRLAPVQKVASLWAEQNKPPGLLVTGAALRDARRWALQNPDAVTSVEAEFLAASGLRHRAERIRRVYAVVVTVLFIAAAGAALWAIHQSQLARSRELAAKAIRLASADSPAEKLLGLSLALSAIETSATREAMQALDYAWQRSSGARFTGHTGMVTSLRWSPDGKYLISGSADGTAMLWDGATGDAIRTLIRLGDGVGVEGVDFSSGGTLVAVAADDGLIRVLNPAVPDSVTVFEGCEKSPVMDVAFGPGDTMLGAGCRNGAALLLNLATKGKTILKGHIQSVNSIRFSRHERVAATAGDDDQVILWNIDSGQRLPYHLGMDGPVFAVQFARVGELVAAASVDGFLWVWSSDSGARRFGVGVYKDGLYSVDISGDGALIAAGGLNGEVNIWRAERGQEYLTLSDAGCNQRDCRAHVAFDLNSKRLAVSSGNEIWLHDLDFTSLRLQARKKLGF